MRENMKTGVKRLVALRVKMYDGHGGTHSILFFPSFLSSDSLMSVVSLEKEILHLFC